jgi:hypothetical protein
MKKGLFCLIVSSTLATFNGFSQTPQLVPLSSFGINGDGSIRPAEGRSYITTGSNLQRGMAYNRTTGHLLVANRNPTSAPTINIVDGVTGADMGVVPYEELVAAGNTGFKLNKIAVADDGAIYAANLTTASTPQVGFVLYRYASETGEQTVVFAGDPSNGAAPSSSSSGRWGDAMTVRGEGINTQILLCSQGNLVAILRPTDDTMTAFIATTLTADATLSAEGLAFGAGDTFWSKDGGNTLRRMSFDLGAGTATTVQTYFSTVFPTRIGPVTEIGSSNLLAGIEIASGPDFVKLYDITDISAPVFLDRENYTPDEANPVYAGEIVYGDGRLYALNSDNGILAFDIVVTNESVAPSIFVQPAARFGVVGSNVTFTSIADGIPTPTYQWFFNETNLISNETNSSLTLSNLQVSNSGFYSMVASNSAGSATSAVVALVVVADPDLYVYEPFNYPVGEHITDFSVAPGQFWTTNGSTANDTLITPGSLDVAGLAASEGNSIANGGAGAAARLAMGGSQSSGSVYASFAMKIDQLGGFGNGVGLIASFVDNAQNDQECRLLATRDGAGFKIGVAKVTSAAGVYDPRVFNEGDQVFIVLRYTFVADGTTNDQADLWINPDPASFATATAPDPTVVGAITGSDLALIDTWAFRQNTTANTPATIYYDELRIGKTWASVTPAPSSGTVALSFARNGNGDVLISWPTNGSENFNLESTSDLSSPATWTPVSEPVNVDGANNVVTIAPTNTQSFFRLKK